MDRRPLGRIREVAQVDVSLAAWEIPLLAAGVHPAVGNIYRQRSMCRR
jgi:hypothetical protein